MFFYLAWHRVVILIYIVIYLLSFPAYAETRKLSLDLNQVKLTDAIHLMAKFLHKDIIISSAVQGSVTLRLHDVMPDKAFEWLLEANGLTTSAMGSTWYVAPHHEMISRKQEAQKWQLVKTKTAPLVTQLWQIKYGNAEAIAHLLRDNNASLLSKRGQVRVDRRTNIVCVQDTPEKISMVTRLIKKFDIPVQQVRIEARLAAVDSDFERELGVNFMATSPVTGVNKKANQFMQRGQTPGRYSVAVIRLADSSLLDVKLSALENAGHARLISSPSLFTANQQLATIEAGEEVPYQETSESGGTAIAFKKAVLGLKATPQILPGHHVLLRLQVNQDRPSNKMVLGVPTISTRKITTNVMVKSGQTIVLGGIYESNHENGQQGLPFIGKIPIIGWLFKQQSTREAKRELLIFVTPTIIA